MSRAVIYCRVSTDEQAESGAGMKAQEDACRQFAERGGFEVVGPFGDAGISGAAPVDRRPALFEAISQLEAGDIFLVAKRDRLGRDPLVVAMADGLVTHKKARVVSAAGEGTQNDDPSSVLMRRLIDGFSEYERLIGKTRTRSALAAKKARGQRTGAIPYGFDLADDGQRSKQGQPVALVANPAEQATLALIASLHLEGTSIRGICRELGRRGIMPKKCGANWSPGSIARILERLPQPSGDSPPCPSVVPTPGPRVGPPPAP